MDVQAILFDVNGTLIDIETDEGREKIYTRISRFLSYQGFAWPPDALRDRYFQLMDAQRQDSTETYPEFDVVALWRALLGEGHGPATPLDQLPLFLAGLHRTLARRHLALYPDVSHVLDTLRPHYALGVVSDAQSAYALPELREVGLDRFFTSIVVSGDYGYRKPDSRLFATALAALQVRPEQAVYVGNDMYCDIFGAQRAGLRTIFFETEYGRKTYEGILPDGHIHRFAELPAALAALTHTP